MAGSVPVLAVSVVGIWAGFFGWGGALADGPFRFVVFFLDPAAEVVVFEVALGRGEGVREN